MPAAGIGSYTRWLVQALAVVRPEAEIRLAMAGPPPPLEWPEPVRLAQVPGPRLVGRHLRWPLTIRGFDAFLGLAGNLPLGRLRCARLITVHDLAIYRRPDWFPSGQPLAVKLVVPASIRRADRILAVSENTRRDLRELFGVTGDRVVVTPLAADGMARATPARIAALRHRFGLPERFILFVGTVEPRKNLLTLLEAWSRMRARPALVIAGRLGWRCDREWARIAELGAHYLGPIDIEDLPALYSAASCLAHPAWYEGFGLTPLEAMACGTPVVVSNAASLPEVTGDAAVQVDPGNVEGWTAALEQVMQSLPERDRLARLGLAQAARFSWRRTAELTWLAIDQAIRA